MNDMLPYSSLSGEKCFLSSVLPLIRKILLRRVSRQAIKSHTK